MKPNPVVHFEMPYEDKQRVADFYTKAFGWKTNMMGPEMGDYVVVHTTETDDKGMIKTPGNINGGFFKKAPGQEVPTVVIAVDDIQKAMKDVVDLGGKLMGVSKGADQPVEIPGIGLYIAIMDTEGNKVALLQPKGM